MTILCLLFAGNAALAQTGSPNYDKVLADSLGADDYGMKMYTFVILKTGPATIDDKQKVGELFRGHMDNINRLVGLKKLIVAGPFMQNERNYRGLFILNVKDKEEAQSLLGTDPAIDAGLLEAEAFEWYGPAALPTYLPFSDRVTKAKP